MTVKQGTCGHCNGRGFLLDDMPKSKFAALDWLSMDGEVCQSCKGTGEVLHPIKKDIKNHTTDS